MGRRKKNFATEDHTAADDPKAPSQLNLTFETAEEHWEKLIALQQARDAIHSELKAADQELKTAYEAFEKNGGNAKQLKKLLKMANQDEAQIVADQRAFNQYFEWFLKPKIDRYHQAEAA